MSRLAVFSLPTLVLLASLCAVLPADAVETAPRISDREIIERLARLEDGQAQLRAEMIQRFEAVNQRFEAVNQRFDDMNRRFDILQWMVGLFITVALAIFAAMARTLWILTRSQAAQEKINESLKTEITSLKAEAGSLKEADLRLMDQIKVLIEHLKPPKGAM